MLGRLFGHAALAAPAAAVFGVGLVRVAEPNRGGGESESAATGESRSLASVLAGSSSYSFRGHQVALGDAAGAPTAAPAPAPAPHAGQKRNAMGTEVQRWADRLDRNVIAGQIAEGCKCGCVDTYATAGDIIAQRTLQQKKTGEQRRLFLRGLLPGLLDAEKLIGVELNWGDKNAPACVKGFALRHGFTPAWTYNTIREFVKARGRAARDGCTRTESGRGRATEDVRGARRRRRAAAASTTTRRRRHAATTASSRRGGVVAPVRRAAASLSRRGGVVAPRRRARATRGWSATPVGAHVTCVPPPPLLARPT
jgi:hypothetical protein